MDYAEDKYYEKVWLREDYENGLISHEEYENGIEEIDNDVHNYYYDDEY